MAKSRLIISSVIWVIVALLAHYNMEHVIYFQENSSLFLFDKHYIAWHGSQVGGIANLIVSAVVQFFYYPALGATIIGGLVASIYALLAWSISYKERGDQIALAAVAAVWTLTCHSFPAFISILVVVALSIMLFKVMTIRLKAIGYLLAPLVVVIAFLLVGLPFYMPATIFALYILISKERRLLKIAYIAVTLLLIWGLPKLVPYIYPQSMESVEGYYDKLIPEQSYDTFTIIWAIYMIVIRFSPKIKSAKLRAIISAIVVAATMGWAMVIASSSNGSIAKTVIAIRQLAEKEQWEELLNRAKQEKVSNLYVTYLTNIALYKTGRFNTQIFAYPQQYGVQALFFPWSIDDKIVPIGHYAYECAGIINEAHRWVFEQSTVAESGYALSKLVDYNREIGRPKVANRFAKLLNRSLFYHKDLVEEVAKEDTSSYKFSNLLTSPDGFEMNLRQAVEIDPSNKAASDYLMVYLLMMGRVADFAAVVDIPQQIYKDQMPEIYHEAMALYARSAPEKFAESGYKIPEQTIARLRKFESTMQSSGGNPGALAKEFRGSFWFYDVFANPYKRRQ